MKRILVLYRELAGYFVECLNHLCEQYNVEAHVVAYPVNSDAPFQFAISEKVKIYQRKEYSRESLIKLVEQGKFDLIFSGGWFDKEYLEAIQHRKCPALLGFDNQWNGSFRHFASAIYGRLTIKPKFEYAFVPGTLQKTFAHKLGFREDKIISGAYSCDVHKFSALQQIRNNKKQDSPKKLIYAGRYAHEKFIQPLCELIKNMSSEEIGKWELHCIGTGPLWNEKIESNRIIHHGFLQPSDLFELMKEGDAFVLPSTFEPWGVVVHEFASAGFPMVLSSAIGSAEVFLINNENGFIFQSGDVKDLKLKLTSLFSLNDEKLRKMGEKSAKLAMTITPDTWAKSLKNIM